MNVNSFEGAEITIYTQAGGQFNFELSPMQVYVTLKLLGFQFEKGNNSSYSCYSDKTLDSFLSYKSNPLNLKLINK